MYKINLTLENTEKSFKLISDSTIYAQFLKPICHKIDLKELIQERKEFIKTCRKNKIKVSTKQNDEIIKTFYLEYYKDLEDYKTICSDLERLYLNIYKEGLYAPTGENEQLKTAEQLYFKLQQLLYRNKPLNLFKSIKLNLEEIKQEIKRGANFSRISI
jgi:N-glycosylase/DNA lyase